MNINGLIDKLNNELEKLNKLKSDSIDTNTFFTNNEHFNDDFSFDSSKNTEDDSNTKNNLDDFSNIENENKILYKDIEPNVKETSLVTLKEQRLLSVQNVLKRV